MSFLKQIWKMTTTVSWLRLLAHIHLHKVLFCDKRKTYGQDKNFLVYVDVRVYHFWVKYSISEIPNNLIHIDSKSLREHLQAEINTT